MEDYLAVLRREFSAEEGTFLLQLRVKLHWDKEAFDRLTEAMFQCCKHFMHNQQDQEQSLPVQPTLFPLSESLQQQYAQAQAAQARSMQTKEMLLPRWLAEGFWYVSHFIKYWTSHQAWDKRRALEPEYFNKAYERVYLLASWFFTGEPPWNDIEKGWASTFV